jgi:hypothetical protein
MLRSIVGVRALAVEALVSIRAALRDPDNVLGGWVVTSGGDPCGWKGVTCSDGLIHTLCVSPLISVGA